MESARPSPVRSASRAPGLGRSSATKRARSHMWTGLRAFGKTASLAALVVAIGACSQETHQPLQSSQVAAGSRTGVTSVSTLAAYRVGDRRFVLVSFDNQSGAPCIAVDQPGVPGIAACGIALNAFHQVNAAIQNMGGGITAIYGRAGNSVRQIQAISRTARSLTSLSILTISAASDISSFSTARTRPSGSSRSHRTGGN